MSRNGKKVVLLTGGAGVLGKKLARRLLQHDEVRVIILVRAESDKAARERFKGETTIYENAEILRADLSDRKLILSDEVYDELAERVTHILHAAASTRFNLSLENAYACNVATVKNILTFAEHCKHLKRFVHISTALVAGKRSGVILESEFEHDAGFLNTYQESKYAAEKLVREYAKNIPAVILRPPLLVDSQKKSSQKPTNALLLSVFLARRGLLPLLPGTPQSTFDIMDSSIAAELIAALLLKDELQYDTYHITSGGNTLTINQIILYIEEHMRGKRLSFTFTGDMHLFQDALQKAFKKNPALRLIYAKTGTFLPELAYPKVYDNRRVLDELHKIDVNHNAQDALKSIFG